MSIIHTKSTSGQSTGSKTVSGSWQESGSTEVTYDAVIAASTTDQEISVAFAVADVQSVILLADKGCTLQTNDGTTPADTITLKPGIPLEWSVSSGYFANPFGTDVTSIFVTTTVATRLQIKVLTS